MNMACISHNCSFAVSACFSKSPSSISIPLYAY